MKSPKLSIILALALALLSPAAVGCGRSDTGDDPSSGAFEQKEDASPTDGDIVEEEPDEGEAPEGDNGQESEGAVDEERQRVGEVGVGFVEVPASWMKFVDVDGTTSLQWCDGTPYTIISLDVFDLSGLSEDQRSELTLEDAADSVAGTLIDGGAVEDSLQGAHVTLAGREALQVYCSYPDGIILVTWVLEADDGSIRYVAAEGTMSTVLDAVEMVEDSYSIE